ncbi:hypothetical protein [Nannocystis punicea]|uniref:Uncharacterized protein n=1 Tax=Nannocystis punicea TaxID=2995304 RepID=A0ABY7HE95_9BACT|nr:hypothetical protein [Nannocystis poenicansa]WAS97400.1 hypothetical protein O0S08_14730 [Nannocystis poenicansa]
MTILEALHSGSLGVHFDYPDRYHVPQNGERDATLVDPEGGFGMRVVLHDLALDLDPAHEDAWRQDVERDARALFERFFAMMPRDGAPAPKEPRTADASWSPVIETGRVRLGAGHGVTVLHRLCYEPGHETVMGHLLVPLDGRMLELIVVETARGTGLRESVLTNKALAARGDEDLQAMMRRLDQRHIDDPAHDADFPGHPVTRARAALRELLDTGAVVVMSEPPARPRSLEIDALGLALTPPARYAPVVGASEYGLQLSRLSFSGTDGLRLLSLVRMRGMRVATTAELMQLGDAAVRQTTPPGATAVQLETILYPGDRVETLLRYTTDTPRHTVYRWRTLADGTALMIACASEDHVPVDELRADIDALVGSLRELETEAPPRKPWWKFW